MRVRTNVKAGGISGNHNQSLLQVKTGVKAGGINQNHNQSLLRVKTGVKAGGSMNHNQSLLRVKTGVKAGGSLNHNQTLLRSRAISLLSGPSFWGPFSTGRVLRPGLSVHRASDSFQRIAAIVIHLLF